MARVTVEQGFAAVVRRDGVVVSVLGPGRHPVPGPWLAVARRRTRVTTVDVRRRLLVVAGQELAAADVPGVRVSVVLDVSVADPAAFATVAQDPFDVVRTAAQLALRDAVAARPLDALTAERAAVSAALLDGCAVAARAVGVQVHGADVRDVTVPAELRRALLAVRTAQAEGLAALERARGETAALRALANGARVLAEHPGLLQLRTAQVAAAAGGTVELRPPSPPA